jgi:nicotinamide N-methyltransferase
MLVNNYLKAFLYVFVFFSLKLEGGNNNELFDVILMADLLFNRSEHSKLLWTIQQCLKKDGTCYITFSHHDPQKKNLDLNFFTLAAGPEFDFKVKYIGQERRPSYPFVELDGMDEDRGIVYYYTLTYF